MSVIEFPYLSTAVILPLKRGVSSAAPTAAQLPRAPRTKSEITNTIDASLLKLYTSILTSTVESHTYQSPQAADMVSISLA
jgi:hypothetical protein